MEPQPQTETDIPGRLQQNIDRIDAELARTASQYDSGRKQLAAQHGKMETGVTAHQAKADKLRPELEGVVFGGKQPGKGFPQQARAYQEAVANTNQARLARRMAFGATQPPGKVPLGQPLGTEPPA